MSSETERPVLCCSGRILLVRHAESFTNLDNQLSCLHVDLSLTPNGIQQARKTAQAIRARRPECIFTSPLRRAQETADILATECGIRAQVVEEFREVNVGALESEPNSKKVWAIHDQIITSWARGNTAEAFPMGENYEGLLSRFRRGLLHVVEETDGRVAVIVGHGGIFRYTIKDICPDAMVEAQIEKTLRNCSISEIEGLSDVKGVFRLIAWAEDAHLD